MFERQNPRERFKTVRERFFLVFTASFPSEETEISICRRSHISIMSITGSSEGSAGFLLHTVTRSGATYADDVQVYMHVYIDVLRLSTVCMKGQNRVSKNRFLKRICMSVNRKQEKSLCVCVCVCVCVCHWQHITALAVT